MSWLYTPIAGRSLAILISALTLGGFVWLLIHNQEQSEYLIFYDFWRNFHALAGAGRAQEYIFHNVHTYAVASLFWYLDVVLASGTLELFHFFVLAATAGAFVCVLSLTIRFYRAAGLDAWYGAAAAITAMALWLSPSNGVGLTYPLVDIVGSVLLLCLSSSAIVLAARAEPATSRGQRNGHLVAYLGIAVIGFFSLEAYVAVPLTLALDAAIRRRAREAWLHLAVALFLLALYALLRESPILASVAPTDRHLLAFVHNFLLFLSMHVLVLLSWLGTNPGSAARISIATSVLELLFLTVFAITHYSRKSREDLSPRFALLFIGVGSASLALAAWLRYSTATVTTPVDRYTPYAVLFSIGVFLLSSRALFGRSVRVLRYAAALALLPTLGYLATDTWAFWFRSYNPGMQVTQWRMEMPVYATSPGAEIGLGPSEPDGGRAFRSSLHGFLETHALSVFSSAGYRALGALLPEPNAADTATCRLLRRQAALGSRPRYSVFIFAIEGEGADGVFLVTDGRGAVSAFGLPARFHPAQPSVAALLPSPGETAGRIYYAQVRGSTLATAIPCL